MTGIGLRKSALYLASLPSAEQAALLAAMPADASARLRPLIATVVSHGWNDPDLVARALAEEIHGLTTQTSLSVDALIALARALPPDWAARVIAANSGTDPRFLVGLLDSERRDAVQTELQRVPRLPSRLRDALLAEASASLRHA